MAFWDTFLNPIKTVGDLIGDIGKGDWGGAGRDFLNDVSPIPGVGDFAYNLGQGQGLGGAAQHAWIDPITHFFSDPGAALSALPGEVLNRLGGTTLSALQLAGGGAQALGHVVGNKGLSNFGTGVQNARSDFMHATVDNPLASLGAVGGAALSLVPGAQPFGVPLFLGSASQLAQGAVSKRATDDAEQAFAASQSRGSGSNIGKSYSGGSGGMGGGGYDPGPPPAFASAFGGMGGMSGQGGGFGGGMGGFGGGGFYPQNQPGIASQTFNANQGLSQQVLQSYGQMRYGSMG